MPSSSLRLFLSTLKITSAIHYLQASSACPFSALQKNVVTIVVIKTLYKKITHDGVSNNWNNEQKLKLLKKMIKEFIILRTAKTKYN